MSFPDFRKPLSVEIELARQINLAAYAMLPWTSGGDNRADLSAVLAHIALEHIGAILSLFANGALTSGYALMRPALETTYKSVWIASVAEDIEVTNACMGHDVYGSLKDLIKNLERGYEGTSWTIMFGKIRPHIRSLHERTHSGRDQTLRRLKAEDMRVPEYDFGELIMDIRTLAGAAILAAFSVATQEDIASLNSLMVTHYPWLAGNPPSDLHL